MLLISYHLSSYLLSVCPQDRSPLQLLCQIARLSALGYDYAISILIIVVVGSSHQQHPPLPFFPSAKVPATSHLPAAENFYAMREESPSSLSLSRRSLSPPTQNESVY